MATTANAKLIVSGAVLEDLHIDTIKGHLYESTRLRAEQGKPDTSDIFARSIEWMNKLHKSEKTFDIGKISQKEAKVITASIYFISRVEKGEYVPNIMPATIGVWIEIGRLVIIDKEKDSWKLKIKVIKKKTK
tara:strand:+ start:539 stop:937 length:399 start_codon:yes stop_codon:yes gene_type:complete